MMVKKIFFVTETCFYPIHQGDSARISTIISFFKSKNWQIHVLHFHDATQEHANYEMMASLCDSFTVYYPTTEDLQKRTTYIMDDWCPSNFVTKAKELIQKIQPHVMFVQFVFFSATFNAVDKNSEIIKVLDADNIFSNRSKLYESAGIDYQWFSTDVKQERQGLLRADIVLAIQEREQEVMEQLVPERRVLLAPHVMETNFYPDYSDNTLLFVGAANVENIFGISNFISNVFPKILHKDSQVKLLVAGKVCEKIKGARNVELLGIVPNLSSLYQQATIVLNTTPIGTGLKIKTVEALCHGKCLLSTPAGISGLEKYPEIYYVALQEENFFTMISHLLVHKNLIEKTALQAYEFSTGYFSAKRVLGRLEDMLLERLMSRTA